MGCFKYSSDKINKMIEESDLQKVIMHGCYEDLKRLKPIIEKLYDDYIFYLSYWEGECPYFGWSWSKDGDRLKNQAKITDGITERFQEIYALILAGLGEKCEENN